MSHRIVLIACMGVVILSSSSCKKQTTPEAVNVDPKPPQLSSEQEAALLSYKKNMKNREVMFAWVGPSSVNSSPGSSLKYIPDSIDIISFFTGYTNDPQIRKDVKFLQEHRGTRVLVTMFSPNYFGEDPPHALDTVRRWAKRMSDSIKVWGVDGFDMDYEPGYGGTQWPDSVMEAFLKVMNETMGPYSGTDKLLLCDGVFPHPTLGHYLSYFVSQIYGVNSDESLQENFDWRVPQGGFNPHQFIAAEWTAHNTNEFGYGGVEYTDYKGNETTSLLGYAAFEPTGERKGGTGMYTLGSYNSTVGVNVPVPPNNYYYARKTIQIMNPAVH